MKQIDEIVRSFEQCNNCGGCKGCAYEDEESCADNLEEDVLEILRKVQGGKRMKITTTTPEIKDLEKRLAEEKDRAEAWELRCEELEQELREAQDRIHEQDWTIGQYDDENRKLREQLRKCGEKPFPVTLNEWTDRIHRIAVDHGWWESEDGMCDDGVRSFPEIVALCHSELSEALEEYRRNKPMAYQVDGTNYYPALNRTEPNKVEDVSKWRDDKKPEGIAVEMLDCIIRILDWMGHEGVDVDTLMEKKVKYNEGRKHRHGGKKA